MRYPTLLAALAISIGFTLLSAAQDLSELGQELRTGDLDARREAALLLREMAGDALPALPALIEALADDDEQVAARAVTAIARIGPAANSAIPALIESMDPQRRRYDEQVVFRAAFALGKIGKLSIDPLRGALGSESIHQRSGAAQALQFIGAEAAPAIPELIKLLRDLESAPRQAAAAALAAIGLPALEPLQADLERGPSVAVVRTIGLIGEPAAGVTGQLLELLERSRENKPQHAAIIVALGRLGTPFDQLQAPLLTALTDYTEEVRRAAANVLLGEPDPQEHSLPMLRSWLSAEDKELRSRAAWAVGQFGADAASLAPALITRLEQGDDPAAITEALAAIGPGATGAILRAVGEIPLADLNDDADHWVRAILRTSSPLAMPALEGGLGSEHASIRFVALEGLAGMGKVARPLAPKFHKACNDPEAPVRLAALIALDSAGSDLQRLVTILSRRCSDPSGEVRVVAVRLLGQTPDLDSRALGLIDQALSDPDFAVQLAAVEAIEKVGAGAERSIPRLLEIAAGAEADTRLAILKTMASIGSAASDALPLVRESLADPDPQIRGAAIAALVAIEPAGARLTELLCERLEDKEHAGRHPAIAGLGQLGEAAVSAAPQLFELLDRGQDRSQVIEALRLIRSRDVDLYMAALKNSDPQVRLFACQALGRLGKAAVIAIPALERAEKDRASFVRRSAADAIQRIRK